MPDGDARVPTSFPRVELVAASDSRRQPRIDVFHVAGGPCACCVPLSDDSTTEGGW